MTTGFQCFMTKQVTAVLVILAFALIEINIIRSSQCNLINSFSHEGKRKQALQNSSKPHEEKDN